MHLTGSGQQLVPAAGEARTGKLWPREAIFFRVLAPWTIQGRWGSSASSQLMNHYNCAMHMCGGERKRASGEKPAGGRLASCGHQAPRELNQQVLG